MADDELMTRNTLREADPARSARCVPLPAIVDKAIDLAESRAAPAGAVHWLP